MNYKFLFFLAMAMTTGACSQNSDVNPAERVNSIANDFVEGFYSQYPEEAYESGFPNAPTDRFSDQSTTGIMAWDASVDEWIKQMDGIDVSTLNGTPEAITWMFARDRLQAIVDRRVCRTHLWNVSPTWTGWHTLVASTLALQPVETTEEKQRALARAADLERFIDTEISNLRRGVEEGYLAPRTNVSSVIGQISSLIDTTIEDSPYFGPAARSEDAEFVAAYRDVMAKNVLPAMLRYRGYLAEEYEGRDEIGVRNNPDGEECYRASVRSWSSLIIDPEQIHRTGLAQMSRIRGEMLAVEIGRAHV